MTRGGDPRRGVRRFAAVHICLALLAAAPTSAFVFTQSFVKGGPNYDLAWAATTDGEYLYIAGETNSSFDGQSRSTSRTAFVSKLATNGTTMWTRFANLGSESGAVAATFLSGAIYVAGWAVGILEATSPCSQQDAFLAKLDENGTLLNVTLKCNSQLISQAAVMTSVQSDSTSLYIAWEAFASSTGSRDVSVARLNADLTQVWSTTYSSSGLETGAVTVLFGDTIYVAGTVNGVFLTTSSTGSFDFFLAMQLKTTGSVVWSARDGTADHEFATGVSVSASRVYVVGFTLLLLSDALPDRSFLFSANLNGSAQNLIQTAIVGYRPVTFTLFSLVDDPQLLFQTSGQSSITALVRAQVSPLSYTSIQLSGSSATLDLRSATRIQNSVFVVGAANGSIGFLNSTGSKDAVVLRFCLDFSFCAPGSFGACSPDCEFCAQGRFSNLTVGTLQCAPCEVGRFGSSINSTTCTLCPAGRFAAAPAATDCDLCPVGRFSDELGSTLCSPCPGGRFGESQDSTEPPICSLCPQGRFSLPGSTSCELCPLGRFASSSNGSSLCEGCAPGRFSDETGATECSACPAGSFAEDSNSSNCSLCPPGTYGETHGATSNSTCQLCPPGTHQPDFGESACLVCGPGTFSPATRQSTCTECPGGRFSNATNATICASVCSVGRFSSAVGSTSNATCQVCPTGRFGNTTALDECHACPNGTFLDAIGATSVDTCTSCPEGTFSPVEGAQSNATCAECPEGRFGHLPRLAACLPCPTGRVSTAVGQVNDSQCTPCQAGTFGAEGASACASCTAGRFANVSELDACFPCPGGRFSTAVGMINDSSCTGCPLGRFSDDLDPSTCQPCLQGRFGNETALSACHLCPAGRFLNTQQATSAAACQLCAGGRYAPTAGSSACAQCNPGSASIIVGATSPTVCVSCSSGSFSAQSGATGCDSCALGRFSSQTNATVCSQCAPGTFGSLTGLSECFECPIGKFSTAVGATSAEGVQCSPCAVGRFSNLTASTSCMECPQGRFRSTVGGNDSSSCILCPAGRAGTQLGMQQCAACPAGTFSTAEGLTSLAGCTPCPQGRFSASTGGSSVDSCNLCPAGRFGDRTGLTDCTTCVAGRYSQSVGLIQSDDCTACLPGRFSTSVGAAFDTCQLCPTGRYETQSGATACSLCPVGTYLDVTGRTSALACISCSAGRFGAGQGGTSLTGACALCAAGTFSASGASVCQQCGLGRFSGSQGLSTCAQCQAGRYASVTGLTACTLCGLGTYSPSLGASNVSVCLACPIGKSGLAQGLSACVDCNAGRYAELTRQTACTDCPAGRFLPTSGRDNASWCEPCPAGSFSSAVGQANASTCQECPVPSLCVAGSASAVPCPPRTYLDDKQCKPCGPTWPILLAFAAVIVLLFVILFFFQHDSTPFLLLRIVAHFLQVAALVILVETVWPTFFRNWADMFGSLSISMGFANARCYVDNFNHHTRLIVSLAVPFVLVVAIVVISFVIKMQHRQAMRSSSIGSNSNVIAEKEEQMKNALRVGVLIVSLSYVSQVRFSLSMFRCSKGFLVADPFVDCNSQMHEYARYLSYAVILTIGVFLPFSTYRILKHHGGTSTAFDDEKAGSTLRKVARAMSEPYVEEWRTFEVISMVRKLFLLVATILPPEGFWQASCGVIVCLTYAIFVSSANPYKTRTVDHPRLNHIDFPNRAEQAAAWALTTSFALAVAQTFVKSPFVIPLIIMFMNVLVAMLIFVPVAFSVRDWFHERKLIKADLANTRSELAKHDEAEAQRESVSNERLEFKYADGGPEVAGSSSVELASRKCEESSDFPSAAEAVGAASAASGPVSRGAHRHTQSTGGTSVASTSDTGTSIDSPIVRAARSCGLRDSVMRHVLSYESSKRKLVQYLADRRYVACDDAASRIRKNVEDLLEELRALRKIADQDSHYEKLEKIQNFRDELMRDFAEVHSGVRVSDEGGPAVAQPRLDFSKEIQLLNRKVAEASYACTALIGAKPLRFDVWQSQVVHFIKTLEERDSEVARLERAYALAHNWKQAEMACKYAKEKIENRGDAGRKLASWDAGVAKVIDSIAQIVRTMHDQPRPHKNERDTIKRAEKATSTVEGIVRGLLRQFNEQLEFGEDLQLRYPLRVIGEMLLALQTRARDALRGFHLDNEQWLAMEARMHNSADELRPLVDGEKRCKSEKKFAQGKEYQAKGMDLLYKLFMDARTWEKFLTMAFEFQRVAGVYEWHREMVSIARRNGDGPFMKHFASYKPPGGEPEDQLPLALQPQQQPPLRASEPPAPLPMQASFLPAAPVARRSEPPLPAPAVASFSPAQAPAPAPSGGFRFVAVGESVSAPYGEQARASMYGAPAPAPAPVAVVSAPRAAPALPPRPFALQSAPQLAAAPSVHKGGVAFFVSASSQPPIAESPYGGHPSEAFISALLAPVLAAEAMPGAPNSASSQRFSVGGGGGAMTAVHEEEEEKEPAAAPAPAPMPMEEAGPLRFLPTFSLSPELDEPRRLRRFDSGLEDEPGTAASREPAPAPEFAPEPQLAQQPAPQPEPQPASAPELAPSAAVQALSAAPAAASETGAREPRLIDARFIALHDHTAVESDELTFRAGEEIHVVYDVEGWYLGRTSDGRKGIFPANYVRRA